MNSFANSLFTLLFGWARGLIQQTWTSAASGRYSGFFIWLGDHWFWLAAVLCVGCTVMDFIIWLVRWRPYLVWRTALNRLARRFQGDRTENARRFEQGYQGGVALDIPQEAEAQADPADWEAEAPETPGAWQSASVMNTFTQAVVSQPMEYTWETAELPDTPEQEAPEQEGWQRRFAPPAGYEAPPMSVSARVNSPYAAELPTGRRRRRSEKYERRRSEWRERLIKGDEDEDALLDGLPPAVDRQQAFHEPVYPQKEGGDNDGYTVWQRPVPRGNETNGNRA